MSPPPVSHPHHSKPHLLMGGVLLAYVAATPGIDAGDNGTIRLDVKSEPQPDLYVLVLPEYGGRVRIDDEGYVQGPPELIVEIANTSASIDLHRKMELYRRHDVREYMVWRTYDREIDYFVLREGRYDRLPLHESGTWRSEVFPGLWIAPQPLLAADPATALKVVQEGVASPEHAAFVESLRARRPVP